MKDIIVRWGAGVIEQLSVKRSVLIVRYKKFCVWKTYNHKYEYNPNKS